MNQVLGFLLVLAVAPLIGVLFSVALFWWLFRRWIFSMKQPGPHCD